ncbi:AMP-binding protein, partial [Actinocrinis puniceicyclus]
MSTLEYRTEAGCGREIATLAPDLEPGAGISFGRAELSRELTAPVPPAAASVLVAAVLALLATHDAGSVRIAVARPGALVPLRCEVSPRTPLADLVRRAREIVLAPVGSAPAGAADVAVAVLGPAADGDAGAADGLAPQELERLAHELNWCDLTFVLSYGDDGWRVTCGYDEDLYYATTVAAQLERLDAILARIVADDAALLRDVLPTGIAPLAPTVATASQDAYIAPRSATEAALARIWEQVLDAGPVGADDDFFALGGHSILAVKVLGRLRELFGVALHIDQLFAHRTLGSLAELVDAAPRIDLAAHGLGPVPGGSDAGAVSFSQERMWFLDQWRPGSALYNVPVAVRLTGPVDPAALHRSVQAVVDRHAALRTALVAVDGAVRAIDAPPGTAVPWTAVSWTTAPSGIAEPVDTLGAALEIARAGVAEAFDLSAAPLLRGGLVGYAEQEWLLWLSIHHAACDGWSLEIVLEELTEAYRAGGTLDLPPLALRYADFAAWQRDMLSPEALSEGVQWWREELVGLPPVLELPTDRRRPEVPSFDGRTACLKVEPELADAARGLARSRSVTEFDVFAAVFSLLIGRWSGRSDVVVGTPWAGRSAPQTARLVGCFVNTFPLRTDLSGAPSFDALLERVRRSSARAQAHAHIPFEAIVDALAGERESAWSPLTQVAFGYQRGTRARWSLGDGVDARVEAVDTGTAKFDLTLVVVDLGSDGMRIEVEYATDLFDDATADRFGRQWIALLEGLIARPDVPVTQLSSLTADERRSLVEWAGAPSPFPAHATVDALVARTALARPDAVAVVDGETRVTYAQLLARADGLASRLHALGVRRGALVGLCCRRSADLVVGMLGILRAGGAYVPLDPDHPADRLAFMVADTGVRVVVGHAELLRGLPLDAITTVAVEDAPGHGPGEPVGPIEGDQRTGEDAAYVVYTSGSTGKPKGVVVPHRGITRLVCGVDYVDLGADRVIAQMSNACFDAITFEVWGALAHGGRIVIVPSATLLSAPRLAALLRLERVDTVFITTALFNATVAEVPDAFATVEQFYFGGEALDRGRVGSVLDSGVGPARLHNIYGPTEVTTFAACTPLTQAPATTGPIGRPTTNTWAYVVDGEGALVPVGVPGELWLGGPGVAWG